MNPNKDKALVFDNTPPGIVDSIALAVNDNITFVNSKELQQRLQEFIARGAIQIRLDLLSVHWVDSLGVAVLVETADVLQRKGGKLVLVDANPTIRNILRILKLQNLIHLEFVHETPPGGDVAAQLSGPSAIPGGLPGQKRARSERESLIKRLTIAEIIEDVTPDDMDGVSQAVIRVKKDITIASTKLLRAGFEFYIKLGVTKITIDLSEIAFIDSSGLSVLVEYVKQLQRLGGGLTLLHPNNSIRNILRVVRLDKVIPIEL